MDGLVALARVGLTAKPASPAAHVESVPRIPEREQPVDRLELSREALEARFAPGAVIVSPAISMRGDALDIGAPRAAAPASAAHSGAGARSSSGTGRAPVTAAEPHAGVRAKPDADASEAAASTTDDAHGPAHELTEEEATQVRELEQRDRAVRMHEQAHKAAAGSLGGAPSYEYTTGPDGRRYATGGEVSIDTSAVEGDPAATISKMQQVRRAALAPAEPSNQDRSVAAKAAATERQARMELQEQDATGAPVDDHAASDDSAPGNAMGAGRVAVSDAAEGTPAAPHAHRAVAAYRAASAAAMPQAIAGRMEDRPASRLSPRPTAGAALNLVA